MTPRAAQQVWGISVLRRLIILYMEPEEQLKGLILSKDAFPDFVVQAYRSMTPSRHLAMEKLQISASRLAIYRGSVRSVSTAHHEQLDSFRSYDQILTLYPNSVEISSWNKIVELSRNLSGQTARWTIVLEQKFDRLGDGIKIHWPASTSSHWSTTAYEFQLFATEHGDGSMSETCRSEWNEMDDPWRQENRIFSTADEDDYAPIHHYIPPFLLLPLCRLELSGHYKLQDLTYSLKQRQLSTDFEPISQFVLKTPHCDLSDLNEFFKITKGSLKSCTFQPSNSSVPVERYLTGIDWDSVRGIQSLEITVKVQEEGKVPTPDSWTKDTLHPQGPAFRPTIDKPCKSMEHLNLRRFTVNLQFPPGTCYDYCYMLLPSCVSLADSMLSIGGPLCQYKIRLVDEAWDVDDSDTKRCMDLMLFEEVYFQEVVRTINHRLFEGGGSGGRMKVPKLT